MFCVCHLDCPMRTELSSLLSFITRHPNWVPGASAWANDHSTTIPCISTIIDGFGPEKLASYGPLKPPSLEWVTTFFSVHLKWFYLQMPYACELIKMNLIHYNFCHIKQNSGIRTSTISISDAPKIQNQKNPKKVFDLGCRVSHWQKLFTLMCFDCVRVYIMWMHFSVDALHHQKW